MISSADLWLMILYPIMNMEPELEVVSDVIGNRFYVALGGEGVLLYSLKDEVMDLYHTEVPASLRGKGVGALLVKSALEYAFQNGFGVRPTCTYVQHYLSKHPEYQQLVRT